MVMKMSLAKMKNWMGMKHVKRNDGCQNCYQNMMVMKNDQNVTS